MSTTRLDPHRAFNVTPSQIAMGNHAKTYAALPLDSEKKAQPTAIAKKPLLNLPTPPEGRSPLLTSRNHSSTDLTGGWLDIGDAKLDVTRLKSDAVQWKSTKS